MKAALFSFLLLSFVSTSVSAQFSLGGHVNALFPIGDFSTRTQSGFGFDVEGRFGVDKPLMTSASIGFHSFSIQNGGSTRFNFTPITLSLLYNLSTTEVRPYLGLGVGINRASFGTSGFRVTNSYFGVSPVFGIQYRSSEQVHFDLNAKYQLTFANNNGALTDVLDRNAAYLVFNLGAFYTFGQ